jgi:hypothetical protein
MSVYPDRTRATASRLFLISADPTQYVHSVLIESLDVTLVEVHDIELDDPAALSVCMPVSLLYIALPGAADFEVEPERAPLGVGVHFHQQVVLIFVDHIGRVQVSTFKVRIER